MVSFKINKFPYKNPIEITMYESIDDLPAKNHMEFNKYMLLSSGLGTEFKDIDENHLSNMLSLINDKEKLTQVINNLRGLVWNILEGTNVNNLAFCTLIYSINGKELTDFSLTNLRAMMEVFSAYGLTASFVKKKFRKQGKTFRMN